MFLQKILMAMKDLYITEEDFVLYKDSLTRRYRNFEQDPPLKQSKEILNSVLYSDFSTHQAMLSDITSITYEDFAGFIDDLYKLCN